jgi:Autotransporter beta-domain
MHDGFYLRYVGLSSAAWLTGSGPSGSAGFSGSGAGANLAIGGTPGEGFVVGGSITVLSSSGGFRGGPPGTGGDISARTTALGLLADWFPAPRHGWHVGGTLAIAVVSATVPLLVANYQDVHGLGFGGSVFGGYDWWLGPEWSLGLMAAVSSTSLASMQHNNGNDAGYQLAMSSLGIGVTLLHH